MRAGSRLTYLEQVEAYSSCEISGFPTRSWNRCGRASENSRTRRIFDDLEQGLRTWERTRAVPTDRIVSRCTPILEAAKRDSLACGIPVPDRVAVDVVVLSSPYYAYVHYHGDYRGTVESDVGPPVDRRSAQHSICHEAFPGHQHRRAARSGQFSTGPGLQASPAWRTRPFPPLLKVWPRTDLEMLGWKKDLDDELFSTFNSLLFGVRTNAAILRHQHGEPRQQVIAYMMREAGARKDWAVYQEKFITDPLWHMSFPHYWHGARLIREARAHPGDGRKTCSRSSTGIQTTSTLRTFLMPMRKHRRY